MDAFELCYHDIQIKQTENFPPSQYIQKPFMWPLFLVIF